MTIGIACIEEAITKLPGRTEENYENS